LLLRKTTVLSAAPQPGKLLLILALASTRIRVSPEPAWPRVV
jgi:hypothetical protein